MNRMDINTAKKYLTKKFEQIIEMWEKGIFPDNDFISDFYDLVIVLCDCGDFETESMYELHSSFINRSIKESVDILNNTQNIDFISLFNKQTDKIKFIFFYINKIFIYLERFYIIKNNKTHLMHI